MHHVVLLSGLLLQPEVHALGLGRQLQLRPRLSRLLALPVRVPQTQVLIKRKHVPAMHAVCQLNSN